MLASSLLSPHSLSCCFDSAIFIRARIFLLGLPSKWFRSLLRRAVGWDVGCLFCGFGSGLALWSRWRETRYVTRALGTLTIIIVAVCAYCFASILGWEVLVVTESLRVSVDAWSIGVPARSMALLIWLKRGKDPGKVDLADSDWRDKSLWDFCNPCNFHPVCSVGIEEMCTCALKAKETSSISAQNDKWKGPHWPEDPRHPAGLLWLRHTTVNGFAAFYSGVEAERVCSSLLLLGRFLQTDPRAWREPFLHDVLFQYMRRRVSRDVNAT